MATHLIVGGALIPDWRFLGRDQFRYSDQIVGDQVEEEIDGHGAGAVVFGFAHGAVLLARTEDAFGHRPALHMVPAPRGASVDGAVATLAG